jgi:hypothetical protein
MTVWLRTGLSRAGGWPSVGRVLFLSLFLCLMAGGPVEAQTVTTTTVQGTVYLADGRRDRGRCW